MISNIGNGISEQSSNTDWDKLHSHSTMPFGNVQIRINDRILKISLLKTIDSNYENLYNILKNKFIFIYYYSL